MDNEIANINNMSDEQIKQAIGQDDGSSSGISIPRLGINRSPEDDDGNQLPVGHLFTYDSSVGQNVFGKPVTFRPFISAMQYMHYDPEKGEYVNRSIIFKNLRSSRLCLSSAGIVWRDKYFIVIPKLMIYRQWFSPEYIKTGSGQMSIIQ